MNPDTGPHRWDVFVYGIYVFVLLAFGGYYLYLQNIKKKIEEEQ